MTSRGAIFPRRRVRGEAGAVGLELTLLAPLLLAVLLFVVALGRITTARGQVDGAAAAAARAASLAPGVPEARVTAQRVAANHLADQQLTCAQLHVNVDADAYRPGGFVRVAVRCSADLSELTYSGMPGQMALHSDSTVPISSYRASR